METWTLITGASEGLGVEFARIATKAGRRVILTARSEDKLNALADELRGANAEVLVIPADLSDAEDVEMLWTKASEGRQIDVLVNNAGLGRNGPFDDGGWDRELASMQVNMFALTYLMKQAVPHMKDHGTGRILNVASVAGFLPGPNMAVYHATKAFVLSLSEAVAEELRGTKVTVTALCPGPTKTNFFDDADMDGVRLLKTGLVASADDVALQGWMDSLAAKRVVVPGVNNKLSAFVPRILPRGLATRLTGYIMGKV